MTDVDLTDIETAIADGVQDASEQAVAPFVYRTETTQAARELVSQMGRLESLIAEDETELQYLKEAHLRQLDEQQRAYHEACAIVEARQHDRQTAHDAYSGVLNRIREGVK